MCTAAISHYDRIKKRIIGKVPIFLILGLFTDYVGSVPDDSPGSTFVIRSVSEELKRDEIKRHVIEECYLYVSYKKNRNEFDPYEVGVNILPKIYKGKRQLIERTASSVYELVKHRDSFYRRVLIYNVYYRVCLGALGEEEASRLLPDLMSRVIPGGDIQDADITINELFSTREDQQRAVRDRDKIKVLRFVERMETDHLVKKKTQSVIRELEYDVELWETQP